MIQRQDLEDYLNLFLNVTVIKDFCPNGLQVEGKAQVCKVATAVSANLMTINKAIESSADVLIVHHGLFWNKDPYSIVGVKRQKIDLLLKHNLSLFAYHLPLDIHQEVGNNWQAARDLGWQDLEPFGDYNGIKIGVKGTCPAQTPEVFISKVESYYGHTATAALGGKPEINRVGLISGGAYKELFAAAQENLDCFITGNFDEPAWGVAFEENIHFLALGHSATEKVGPKALARHLRNKFSLECFFLDIPNPF